MDIKTRQLAKQRQLLAVKGILDGMGIPFWLHSGVLLGYYRGRNLIEHDPDLDLGVLRTDLPPDFPDRLAERLEGSGMRIMVSYKSCLKLYPDGDSMFSGSHCDIFIHDKTTGGMRLELEDGDRKVRYLFPYSTFIPVRFLGTEFLVPENPKKAVVTHYGPEWETPVRDFVWDRDPADIEGKPAIELDETPDRNGLDGIELHGNVAVFGPVTTDDAAKLSESCTLAAVLSNQAPRKADRVAFVRCDETHFIPEGLFDMAVVPFPELYNVHNLRSLLESACGCLKAGGLLVVPGKEPECIGEFPVEKAGNGTWTKYAMHENWENNVTAVITTFDSHSLAERCVEAVKKWHPAMRIVVVDNSKDPQQFEGVRTIVLPYDSGLSASRNAGVAEVHTPYVFLNDDDQILTNPDAVKKMYDSVRSNGLGICGGMTMNSRTGLPAMYFGRIERGQDTVHLLRGNHGVFPDGTELVDLTLNFFVARTSVLKAVKWRDCLKICEHLDFFLRAKRLGTKVGHLRSAECLHAKNSGDRPATYAASRNRISKFRKLMMRMNGIACVDEFGKNRTYKAEEEKERAAEHGIPSKLESGIAPKYVLPDRRAKSLVQKFPGMFRKRK